MLRRTQIRMPRSQDASCCKNQHEHRLLTLAPRKLAAPVVSMVHRVASVARGSHAVATFQVEQLLPGRALEDTKRRQPALAVHTIPFTPLSLYNPFPAFYSLQDCFVFFPL